MRGFRSFLVSVLVGFACASGTISVAKEREKPQLDLAPLEVRAEKGDAEAQTALGIFYIAGREVPRDIERGFQWLKRASEAGDARGQYYWGLCFLDGIGTEKELERGLELVRQAEKGGYIAARMFLGKCYLNGQYGLKKETQKALELLTSAAKEEDAEAQFLLGIVYTGTENRVPANRPRMLKWLTLSAQNGYLPAQRILGKEYLESGDTFWAREWLETAYEAGDAEAAYWLAVQELQGWGETVPDMARAMECLRDSAKKGYADAQFLLGVSLLDIMAETMDLEADAEQTKMEKSTEELNLKEFEGAFWLQAATIQNHKDARKELKKRKFSASTCYLMGTSLLFQMNGLKSLSDARRWVEMGAKKGNEKARNLLAMMYLEGIGGPKEAKKGIELLRTGNIEGDSDRLAILARSYFLGGNGLERDTEKARELAEKAIQAGRWETIPLASLGPFSISGVCAFFGKERNVAEERFRAGVQVADGLAIAWTHWTTTHPIPEDVTELEAVLTLIRKSAMEEKNASAQCLLGFAYDYGWGVKEDSVEAVRWYTLAAEQGFATAEVALYWAYSLGCGTEMNEETARKWLQTAVGKAQPQAQFLWRLIHSRIGDFGLEK